MHESNPLSTSTNYSIFIHTLPEQFSAVRSSSVTFIPKGARLAQVKGELYFEQGIRLVVSERLMYRRSLDIIQWYGYEVWQNEEKLYWYDPQPHPDDPSLAENHPHHKHIPPNIKQNRILAPQMSFARPNLPVLIKEIEELIREV